MSKLIRSRIAAVVLLVSASWLGCAKAPEPADIHRQKATELFAASKFAEAAAEFEESLRLNPKQDLKVWEKGAFAFLKSENYDKAAELLKKTLEMKTDNAGKLETYRNIAGMYMQGTQQLDKAEEYFAEAVKIEPKDEQSLTWLAEIAAQRGGARAQKAVAVPEFLEKALKQYDQLITLTPSAPAPYVNKRIVISKYIEHLDAQKRASESDAETNKADKVAAADFLEKAKEYQTKIDTLKVTMEETTKKLGEVQKSAKSAK